MAGAKGQVPVIDGVLRERWNPIPLSTILTAWGSCRPIPTNQCDLTPGQTMFSSAAGLRWAR